MKRILVTGGNKGIGRAICERIVAEREGARVWLGSRDLARGEAARDAIVAAVPSAAGRLEVVELDVSDDGSVRAAADRVGALDGLVNNAGIGRHGHSLAQVLDVNARGVWRVCEAFAPAMPSGSERGRIVIVSSASGPSFVQQCGPNRQAFFTDPDITWERIDALMKQAVGMDADGFRAAGLGSGDAYGLSKACANAIMHVVARRHPHLGVNACTPGFVATDMTRPYAEAEGKSPEAMGMKTPHEGAHAPLHLLFGELAGNAWYYGSDAERSPLDRYRSPGDPPYAPD